MRLYEFDAYDPLTNEIVTVVDQLKSDIDKKGIDFSWDVDTLLQYFRKYDIILDRDDLFNMIEKQPLKSIIKNIKGDEIVFKNNRDLDTDIPVDQSQEIVKKMAKKTIKK